VSQFDYTAGAVPRAAYVDGTDLWVVDDDDNLKTPQPSQKRIAKNVCSVVFPARWAGRGLAYTILSPTSDPGTLCPGPNRPAPHLTVVLYGSFKPSDPGPGVSDRAVVVADN